VKRSDVQNWWGKSYKQEEEAGWWTRWNAAKHAEREGNRDENDKTAWNGLQTLEVALEISAIDKGLKTKTRDKKRDKRRVRRSMIVRRRERSGSGAGEKANKGPEGPQYFCKKTVLSKIW
jgi:hypothetical protein